MGQKIHPIGLRIGINKNWNSKWIAKKGLPTGMLVVEDEKVRNLFLDRFVYAKPKNSTAQKINAEIHNIIIERPKLDMINVIVYCCQPGIILGKNNENIPVLKKEINKIVGRKVNVEIEIVDYKNPYWSARILARKIADLIENRIPYRTAQKTIIKQAKENNIIGIKTVVSGRLNGVDMARKEGYTEGEVPLTSLRADIDYAIEKAKTTAGVIGVKVWLNRGEIIEKGLNKQTPVPKLKEGREEKK